LSTVQRVAKNTGVVIAGDVIFRVLSLIVIIYLARYLGTTDFGKYNLIFAYLAFFGVITDLGLQTILIREMSRDHAITPKLIGNAYVIKLILTVFAVVLAIIVISFMSYPADTTTCVYIAAGTIFFLSFTDIYYAIFQANLKMVYKEIAKLAFKVLSATLILWIIFSQGSLIQVIIALVFSEMVKTLICYLFSRKFVRPRFEIDFGLWKYLFKEAWPIALASVIGVLYYHIDVVMLSIMMGDAEVGLYSAAHKLCDALIVIPNALMISLFPVMSALFKNSKEKLVKSYELAVKYLLIITLPIAVGTTILADKIIFSLYGVEFSGSATALQILIWGIVVYSSSLVFMNLLTSIGKQKLNTITISIYAFGNVGLNFILIPILSYNGASIASVTTGVIGFIIGFYFVSRNFQVLYIYKIISKPVISCLIMGAFVYYFIHLNIILLILLAGVIYVMALLALKTFSEEDWNVFRKVVGKG
jgi:O-antigen/teichoic acid export membrane protein